MQGVRHIHTRQLIALLLMAVMLLVHGVKFLHHHAPSEVTHKAKAEHVYAKAHSTETCSICEYQLAKDASVSTGQIQVQVPAFLSPVYSRLLTSINVDSILPIDGRGPPSITA